MHGVPRSLFECAERSFRFWRVGLAFACYGARSIFLVSGVSHPPSSPTPFEEPTVERTPERFTARGSFAFETAQKKSPAPERWENFQPREKKSLPKEGPRLVEYLNVPV
jgi:hypothetical protein